jgi:hypothetical protein
MPRLTFNQVWKRIVAHEGQKFWTKECKPFTYSVSVTDNVLVPSRTKWNIPKTNFHSAYKMVPFSGPGVINQTHQGPSYVWGILHDARIVGLFTLLNARHRNQYYPLTLFLKNLPSTSSSVTLSFPQIDLILRIALPKSAFQRREWWGNDRYHVQAKAWKNAGFKVDDNGVDLNQGLVRFKRRIR